METNNENLIKILEKDFDELSLSEKQFIRNRIRKVFHLDAKVNGTVSSSNIFQAYLNWKRRYIPLQDMETILIEPKIRSQGGVFTNKQVIDKISISTWDGSLETYPSGSVVFDKPTTLYVLTVTYLKEETIVYCLSPEGNFMKISNCELQFEI